MIDLTAITGSAGKPKLLDYGSIVKPALGGPAQKLNRLGTRFGFDFESIPYETEGAGRRLIALLQQAKLQGAMIIYPQLDFNIGAPGTTLANGAHSAGTTLNIKGATPHYTVRAGQALNVVKSGRRYLYFSASQETLNGTGQGTITLTTPMRTVLAGDEVIDFKKPRIEGFIEGEEWEWAIEAERLTPIKFYIEERA